MKAIHGFLEMNQEMIPFSGTITGNEILVSNMSTLLSNSITVTVHLYDAEKNTIPQIDFAYLGVFRCQWDGSKLLILDGSVSSVNPVVHIQKHASDAKEYAEHFNRKLYGELSSFHAFLVLNGGRIPIIEPVFVKQVNGSFVIKQTIPDRVIEHLKYNSTLKLYVPSFQTIENLEITCIVSSIPPHPFSLVPLKISHGRHTEMETMHFTSPRSAILKNEILQFPKRIRFWLKVTRIDLVLVGLLPVLATLAYLKRFQSSISFALLGLVFCFLVSFNLFNDYYDSFSDEYNPFGGTLHGGSGAIQNDLVIRGQIFVLAFFFATVGTIFALLLLYVNWNPILLLLGLVVVFLGFSFSAPPFKLSSRGFGEIITGLEFGVLPIIGTYLFLTGNLAIPSILIMIGFYFFLQFFEINFTNNLFDILPDTRAGKKTLPILLGQENSVKTLKGIMIARTILVSFIIVSLIDLFITYLLVFLGSIIVLKQVDKLSYPVNQKESKTIIGNNLVGMAFYALILLGSLVFH